MNQTFSVGEVAIYWNENSQFHKTEVTIISPVYWAPKVVDMNNRLVQPGYVYAVSGIKLSGPNPVVVRDYQLRKKRPPQELSSWDKVQEICGWNPVKQVTINQEEP